MKTLDVLTQDLSWRESELGSLKLLLNRTGNTVKQKEVLLRAAWAMLYAHYEGFSKFCLTVFYDRACREIAKCQDLPEKTRVFALESDLKKLRKMASLDLIPELEKFSEDVLANTPSFPDVDTGSNLWPSVLEKLLDDADIVSNEITANHQKIRTLVARRNAIAHGQKNMIKEVEYYVTYEKTVYQIMYELAYLVDDRLKQPPYGVVS